MEHSPDLVNHMCLRTLHALATAHASQTFGGLHNHWKAGWCVLFVCVHPMGTHTTGEGTTFVSQCSGPIWLEPGQALRRLPQSLSSHQSCCDRRTLLPRSHLSPLALLSVFLPPLKHSSPSLWDLITAPRADAHPHPSLCSLLCLQS